METIKSILNIFTADEWNSLGTIVSVFTSVFVFIPGLFAFLKRNRVAEETLREREKEAHRQRICATLPPLEKNIDEADSLTTEINKLLDRSSKEMVCRNPESAWYKAKHEKYTDEVSNKIDSYLNRMERIGVAMTIKPPVYDLETFANSMGGKTIASYYEFRQDIEWRRKVTSRSNLYKSFENLKDELEKFYLKRDGKPFVSKFANIETPEDLKK